MIDPENFSLGLQSIRDATFESSALELFEYQWNFNPVYNEYCAYLGKTPNNTRKLSEIPFLPISFFKTHTVKTGEWKEEKVYLSSGTTSESRSRHLIKAEYEYHKLAKATFEYHFGALSEYSLFALLPSYQLQGNSSLISMVDHFMTFSKSDSGYYLSNTDELIEAIEKRSKEKICLFGVSFSLLDLAENHSLDLKNTIIIETGGMKGKRKEIIRNELHEYLNKKLKPQNIHSEYGMTELTSQAYSSGDFFQFPSWAKVLIRDINDPFSIQGQGKTGGINVIDLANIHSCAFIETQDLGKMNENGLFEVLGRYDNTDIRGCNLLV